MLAMTLGLSWLLLSGQTVQHLALGTWPSSSLHWPWDFLRGAKTETPTSPGCRLLPQASQPPCGAQNSAKKWREFNGWSFAGLGCAEPSIFWRNHEQVLTFERPAHLKNSAYFTQALKHAEITIRLHPQRPHRISEPTFAEHSGVPSNLSSFGHRLEMRQLQALFFSAKCVRFSPTI